MAGFFVKNFKRNSKPINKITTVVMVTSRFLKNLIDWKGRSPRLRAVVVIIIIPIQTMMVFILSWKNFLKLTD